MKPHRVLSAYDSFYIGWLFFDSHLFYRFVHLRFYYPQNNVEAFTFLLYPISYSKNLALQSFDGYDWLNWINFKNSFNFITLCQIYGYICKWSVEIQCCKISNHKLLGLAARCILWIFMFVMEIKNCVFLLKSFAHKLLLAIFYWQILWKLIQLVIYIVIHSFF